MIKTIKCSLPLSFLYLLLFSLFSFVIPPNHAQAKNNDPCVYKIYLFNNALGTKQLTWNPYYNSKAYKTYAFTLPQIEGAFAGQYWLLEQYGTAATKSITKPKGGHQPLIVVPAFKVRSALTGGYLYQFKDGHIGVKASTKKKAQSFLVQPAIKLNAFRDIVYLIEQNTGRRIVKASNGYLMSKLGPFSKLERTRNHRDGFRIISTNCSDKQDAFANWTDDKQDPLLRAVAEKISPLHSIKLNKNEKCVKGMQCSIQAVLSGIGAALPGCDLATICGAIKKAKPQEIKAWIDGGGQCGAILGNPTDLVFEGLGCKTETALIDAQKDNPIRFEYSRLCSATPDQMAKQIVASLSCGTAHHRKSAGIATCRKGQKPLTAEWVQRLQSTILIPGGPQCGGCPKGYKPPGNIFDNAFSGTCYETCPSGYGSHWAKPSKCFKKGSFLTESFVRKTKKMIISPRDACPTGYKAQSKIGSEAVHCMPICNGLAIGETCFGVSIDPRIAIQQKTQLPAKFRKLAK